METRAPQHHHAALTGVSLNPVYFNVRVVLRE